jgi:hypothetical protein
MSASKERLISHLIKKKLDGTALVVVTTTKGFQHRTKDGYFYFQKLKEKQ